MQHDETLLGVSEKVKNFAIICACQVCPSDGGGELTERPR